MSEPVQPEEENPYEAPREPEASNPKELIFVEEDSPEVLRRTYGAHEASVGVIGLYFYLSAVGGLLRAVLALAFSRLFTQELVNYSPPGTVISVQAVKFLMVFAGLVGGMLSFLNGFFLRKLHNWARWVAIVILAIGSLIEIRSRFTVGIDFTLESAETVFDAIFASYVIIILLSINNRVVMSRTYRQIVAQNSEHNPKPSERDWVFLGTATAFYLVWFLIQLSRAVA